MYLWTNSFKFFSFFYCFLDKFLRIPRFFRKIQIKFNIFLFIIRFVFVVSNFLLAKPFSYSLQCCLKPWSWFLRFWYFIWKIFHYFIFTWSTAGMLGVDSSSCFLRRIVEINHGTFFKDSLTIVFRTFDLLSLTKFLIYIWVKTSLAYRMKTTGAKNMHFLDRSLLLASYTLPHWLSSQKRMFPDKWTTGPSSSSCWNRLRFETRLNWFGLFSLLW